MCSEAVNSRGIYSVCPKYRINSRWQPRRDRSLGWVFPVHQCAYCAVSPLKQNAINRASTVIFQYGNTVSPILNLSIRMAFNTGVRV